MQKRNPRPARRLFLQRDIERVRRRLTEFQPFLSRRKAPVTLAEFDQATEQLLGRIFGAASEMLEAYQYAKLGEAASLINLQEEAQEGGVRDVERESLQQRKRVLESCISELETLGDKRAGGPLASTRVADYASTTVRSVHKDMSLKEAGRMLLKWKVGSLLVDDNRRYIGIITDTDLSRRGVARGLDPNTTTVVTCMSKPVVSMEESEPLAAAIAVMKQKGIRHLAVTADGTIIGILSVSDILRAYSDLAGLDAEVEQDE
jgi:signal-transduction protein with cAMP-binding, CBS, and nucleotidyltransferase domain